MKLKGLLLSLLVVSLMYLNIYSVNTSRTPIVEAYFPTVKSGLWYNYTSTGNKTGSLIILQKNEYVKIGNSTVENGYFKVEIHVFTEQFENNSLKESGSAIFNVNISLSEFPNVFSVLPYFFNAKNVENAVKNYILGLSGLIENITQLETHFQNYIYQNLNRTVVVGVINGYKGNYTEQIYAKYVVDNETGLLLEKTYFRYRFTSVKLQVKEALKTVLTDTNFLNMSKIEEPKKLQWLFTFFLAVALVVIAIMVAEIIRSRIEKHDLELELEKEI